ncbi:MAG TPA: hypothetical protein VFF98_07635, partial [Novosphingobium sp.]|nr:hypothetical protein [Novosphingobium sp.]
MQAGRVEAAGAGLRRAAAVLGLWLAALLLPTLLLPAAAFAQARGPVVLGAASLQESLNAVA